MAQLAVQYYCIYMFHMNFSPNYNLYAMLTSISGASFFCFGVNNLPHPRPPWQVLTPCIGHQHPRLQSFLSFVAKPTASRTCSSCIPCGKSASVSNRMSYESAWHHLHCCCLTFSRCSVPPFSRVKTVCVLRLKHLPWEWDPIS